MLLFFFERTVLTDLGLRCFIGCDGLLSLMPETILKYVVFKELETFLIFTS